MVVVDSLICSFSSLNIVLNTVFGCFIVRKSKAADLRRRSIAKQTRDDHRRRSVKALERGRVAETAKAFGGEKLALLPRPKPRNLSLTSDTLNL